MRSFYVDQFKEKDVAVATDGDALTGKSGDDRFMIRVSPAANGSQGRIEVQDRDED